MRRLFIGLLLASACAFDRVPDKQIVGGDDVADLEEDAAVALHCPESEVRSEEVTLLLRKVSGCGRELRYAWDSLGERWVLESIPRPDSPRTVEQ